MDLINMMGAAKLLYDGMVKDKADFAPIPYLPQKTFLQETVTKNPFPPSSPARVGMDGRLLLSAVRELSRTANAGVHSCLVVTDGKCLFDASAPGFSTGLAHATFSMCKTVTALAIGMLIDDGRLLLSDRVYRFFPEYTPNLLQGRMRSLTVAHLLTMTSGVTFAEIGAAVETDYARSYFESIIKSEPGTVFAYNSMNSYILAALVCRVTGKSLTDFLEERLWKPMDITDAFWEKCPQGVEKGGWGLYLSPYSMAKIGMLLLRDGLWQGKRIVSENWIRHMVTPIGLVPEHIGHFDYGSHVWVHRKDGSYLLNGMLGQNVWVCPALDTVVVLTAGENALFQDGNTLNIFLRAFVGERAVAPRLGSPFTALALRREEKRFCRNSLWLSPKADRAEKKAERAFLLPALLGEHSLPENNSGLLPLVYRLMQSNHGEGIHKVTVEKAGKNLLRFTFSEGEAVFSFLAGHHRYHPHVTRAREEVYRTAAAYAFGTDEDRLPILKVALHFPELASVRRLIFRRGEDGYLLTLSEAPGFDVVENLLSLDAGNSPLTQFIKEKLNFGLLLLKAENHFRPTFPLSRGERPKKEKTQKSPKRKKARKEKEK
ncbi:MAG: serine hydrolase [Clostridia bacterium]|nr:serine hydrolase [Clostridia bacterium]